MRYFNQQPAKPAPMQARVRHDDDLQMFIIEIYDEESGEWNYSVGYPLTYSYHDSDREHKDYLEKAIVEKILHMIGLGYQFKPAIATEA